MPPPKITNHLYGQISRLKTPVDYRNPLRVNQYTNSPPSHQTHIQYQEFRPGYHLWNQSKSWLCKKSPRLSFYLLPIQILKIPANPSYYLLPPPHTSAQLPTILSTCPLPPPNVFPYPINNNKTCLLQSYFHFRPLSRVPVTVFLPTP